MSTITGLTRIDSNVFEVPLDKLNGLEDMQLNPREELDFDHIQALMCDDPATYEPVLVATLDNGVSFELVDGYHRVYAAKYKKVSYLRARLVHYERCVHDRPGEIPLGLRLLAYDANTRHGKKLSTQERKDYALLLYQHDRDMSWLQLAKLSKLSDKTVKSYITKCMEEEDGEQSGEGREQSEEQQLDRLAKRLISASDDFLVFAQSHSNKNRVKLLIEALNRKYTDVGSWTEVHKTILQMSRTFETIAEAIDEDILSRA